MNMVLVVSCDRSLELGGGSRESEGLLLVQTSPRAVSRGPCAVRESGPARPLRAGAGGPGRPDLLKGEGDPEPWPAVGRSATGAVCSNVLMGLLDGHREDMATYGMGSLAMRRPVPGGTVRY
jgi:hypothetical protein